MLITEVIVTRSVSPPFGKLHATKLALEQSLRKAFSNLVTHSEVRAIVALMPKAIAAFGGAGRELAIATERASSLWRHIHGVIRTQWWYGMIEDVSTRPISLVLHPPHILVNSRSLSHTTTISALTPVCREILRLHRRYDSHSRCDYAAGS